MSFSASARRIPKRSTERMASSLRLCRTSQRGEGVKKSQLMAIAVATVAWTMYGSLHEIEDWILTVP